MADHGEEPSTVSAVSAVEQFVRASMRALAAAVRDPRQLTAPDSHHEAIDLSVLQPALRTVAPDLGAVAPVVNLRRSLDPLELVLQLPPDPAGDWPLHVTPIDPGRIGRAANILPALSRIQDGRVELTLAQVADLRAAVPALEFAGASVRAPRRAPPEGGPGAGATLGCRSPPGRCRWAASSSTTCTPRWAAARSATRSSARWPPPPSRWCGSAASGRCSATRRCGGRGSWRSWRCTRPASRR